MQQEQTLYVFITALAVYIVCRYVLVYVVPRFARETRFEWDNIILTKSNLKKLSYLLPMFILWYSLPKIYENDHTYGPFITRSLELVMTYLSVAICLSIVRGLHGLEREMSEENEDAAKPIHNIHSLQYAHALYGTVRAIIIGVGILVAIAILFDEPLSDLFTGLGVGAAALGVVFKEVILNAISCIRLTQSDMIRKGDWIRARDYGINGIVEDISLTTVKVRNFDNTMLSVAPRRLMSESFKNWRYMTEGTKGRRVMRALFIDYTSVHIGKDGKNNLTEYRQACEKFISEHPKINHEQNVMVRYLEAQSDGLPMELNFWIADQQWVNYEHTMAEIIEYCISLAAKYEIRLFQVPATVEHHVDSDMLVY